MTIASRRPVRLPCRQLRQEQHPIIETICFASFLLLWPSGCLHIVSSISSLSFGVPETRRTDVDASCEVHPCSCDYAFMLSFRSVTPATL